jgi:hypothetical protein
LAIDICSGLACCHQTDQAAAKIRRFQRVCSLKLKLGDRFVECDGT